MILTAFHGFCMALADSVPGVSGGTIAFILGFYDRFINALHRFISGQLEATKSCPDIPAEIGHRLGYRHGELCGAAVQPV